MTRTFEISPAKRHNTPIIVGLVGPSGSGKTRSALRIATGIVRVQGGKIGLIDTEAKRALHYAPAEGEACDPAKGSFDFHHVPFGAPFSPKDYLEALRFAAAQGCTTIIVDSMSHEHEGPGGVLEMHEAECERLIQAWSKPGRTVGRDAVQMSAWQAPKSARRALINGFLQMSCNFIFCFRAKEKMYIPGPGEKDDAGRKAKPEKKGFMPIAGEELVFEMMVRPLLLPNSQGVPTWQPDEWGERETVKMVDKVRHCFPDGEQLSEKTGECLARWAAGEQTATPMLKAAPTPTAKETNKATVDDQNQLRGALLDDLKFKPEDARAWLKNFFGVEQPGQLTHDQAIAAIELAEIQYSRPDDAEAFESARARAKANGLAK